MPFSPSPALRESVGVRVFLRKQRRSSPADFVGPLTLILSRRAGEET